MRKRRQLPLPPGPPSDPFIGHLRVLPDNQSRAETFHEWSLKYGDVFALRIPGKTIIVLNSEKAASDLLEKRGAIYSDRLRFGYFDAIGWGDILAFVQYGPLHSQQRKLYHDVIGKHAVNGFRDVQEQEVNTLLQGLMYQPNAYDRHVQRFAGGIVTQISYGHRIKSFEDKFFLLSEKWARISHEGTRASLLDLHPIFRHLPSWFPGAWFVDFIKESKPTTDMIAIGNYHKVEKEVKSGTARPSFISRHLEAIYRGESNPDILYALRFSSASIFVGGAETTWHSVTTFIACMLLHPEVQRKAQEEIDRVIGRDRLPDFSDRYDLPYVDCVLQETLRWQPVLPIGLPHQSTTDDVYNGMRIPKGSIIVANTRSITWDENKFHEARSYKPERFLPKPEGYGEVFPINGVFGWGRRMCAGRYLADDSLWLAMSRILAVFTISSPKGDNGSTTEPNIEFETGFTRHAKPFPCNMEPRDEKALRIVHALVDS